MHEYEQYIYAFGIVIPFLEQNWYLLWGKGDEGTPQDEYREWLLDGGTS